MIIKTGYYDWNDFGIKDSFYPEDMPKEWRLSFYANEHECVQIALAGLDKIEDINELFEDLPEQFDLIVRCDEVAQWPLLGDLLASEEVSIKAIVLNELCQQQWSEQLAKLSVPVFMPNDRQSLNFKVNMKSSQLLNSEMNIVYVSDIQTLKQWRAFIDQWVAEESAEEYYLLLKADVFNSSVSSELRLMIEMMGY